MGKKIDLTGQRFGKWTVLRESEKKDNFRSRFWMCMCECGEKRIVNQGSLRNGNSTSCGCIKNKDITGNVYGNLTVMGITKPATKEGRIWDCQCSCGVRLSVSTGRLQSGNTKSCGCIRILDLTGMKFGRLTALTNTGKRCSTNGVVWECKCECGENTQVISGHLVSGHTLSCGCLRKDALSFFKGENHPRYNPNLTDEDRLRNRYDMNGNNLNGWRNEIYIQDRYTCQICGDNTGGNLNAHHINAWNAFPEQRFDTANGITLCEECHKEYHHFNGYGDNTLEEFRDHIACTVGEEHISEIEETLLSRESEIIGQEQQTRELQTI